MDSEAVGLVRQVKKRRRGAQGGTAEAPPSAFRLAERQYKLYRNPKLREQQCFANVVDFRDLEANTDANREKVALHKEIAVPENAGATRRTLQVFSHKDRQGFYFIPGALSPKQQLHWAGRCLSAYPRAPHHTNLGIMPFSVWQAHAGKDSKVTATGSPSAVTGKRRRNTAEAEEGPTLLQATVLPADAPVPPLSKLRWATLGYHYDWTSNVYHEGPLWHTAFPSELAELVRSFTSACLEEPFSPEAAIVNYYQAGEWHSRMNKTMRTDFGETLC